MNKKYLLVFLTGLLIVPWSIYAAFEHDLYFGMRNNDDVRELQQFLTAQNMYAEKITGNFFAITQDAVKRFQERESIIPAAGYFGQKTRAKVNTMLGGTAKNSDRAVLLKFLQSRIAALQKELVLLQEQQKKESEILPLPPPSPVPVPPPTATTTPPASPPGSEVSTSTLATTTIPLVVTGVKFGGESTTTFPATVSSVPLKIDDIIIRNDTNEPLLFSQLEFDIYDTMNSTLNRGREITLFLRQGSTTLDTLISKTKFTFNANPPPLLDGVHRYQVKTEYPILFAAGETKSAGFLIENLEYVVSGTLKFALYDIQTSRTVNRVGGFSFLLTR